MAGSNPVGGCSDHDWLCRIMKMGASIRSDGSERGGGLACLVVFIDGSRVCPLLSGARSAKCPREEVRNCYGCDSYRLRLCWARYRHLSGGDWPYRAGRREGCEET